MLSTKTLVSSLSDIPSNWLFQYYCDLPEVLTGQDVKITSIFSPGEHTPSMSIFLGNDDKYRFNCFSTGKKGDGVDVVAYNFNLSMADAIAKVMEDYKQWKKTGGTKSTVLKAVAKSSRYKVAEYKLRSWSTDDARFWSQFKINSTLLAKYQVRPLASYTMVKLEATGPIKFLIAKTYCYGYFKKDGTLYKIYQPADKEHKFIKVINSYIQGSEQLIKKKYRFMLYLSSLKDIMCVDGLGIKMAFRAPDSENTMMPDEIIQQDLKDYEVVLTLFDNDPAGIKAMQAYKTKYGIDFVYFNLAKDPSDAVKSKNIAKKEVRDQLVIKINQKLNPIL